MTRNAFLILFLQTLTANAQSQDLEYFISQGLQKSPLLKDYQYQVNSIVLDSALIRASQKAQINANAEILYAPAYKYFGYDEAITNGGNYSGVVGISQPFFNRTVLTTKIEGVDIQKRSILNSSKISSNDLKKTIANQYLNAYADYSDLIFNKAFLKIMNTEKEILRQLVEHGLYKQTDYLAFVVEVQSQEILVNQTKVQYERNFYALNQICGLNDTNKYSLALPVIKRQDNMSIYQSPLILQYKIDSLKIANEKITIDMRYRPKFNWFADAGAMSSSPLYLYKHFGYSAGLNLSVPIYDGNQKKIEYQKLAISENKRANYESFYKNQYNQQIQQLNQEMASEQEMEMQLKKQLITVEELISLSKAQISTGNMQITEFINVMKNYINVKHNLNQIQVRKLQTENELNYLTQQ